MVNKAIKLEIIRLFEFNECASCSQKEKNSDPRLKLELNASKNDDKLNSRLLTFGLSSQHRRAAVVSRNDPNAAWRATPRSTRGRRDAK